jgi:lipopolysaccharide heptosyltransferase I
MSQLPSTPASILIVRLGAMGDVLHAMPAVAALRQVMPEAHIGWAIERRWAELLISTDGATAISGGRNLVDSIHKVDTRGWRKHPLSSATMNEIRGVFSEMRGQKYAIAIDIQGASKSALVAKFSHAKSIYGFSHPRERLATFVYSAKVDTHAAHVIDQNLELCSATVHQVLTAGEFDLPRSPAAEHWCEETLKQLGISSCAILNPGSGWGAKCWPAERYAAVAKRLQLVGVQSIVNHGPGEENLVASVAALSDGAARAISPTLPQLISLTRRASLFIGGDTGPLHLAAALKVPVVALFGPTDPARNGPYGTRSVIVRSGRSVTSYSHVAAPDPGLQSVTVEEVVGAAAQLLGVTIG